MSEKLKNVTYSFPFTILFCQKRKQNRLTKTAVSLLGAFAMLFSGCSGSAAAAPSESAVSSLSPTTVKFWTYCTTPERDQDFLRFQQILKEKNPDIKLEYLGLPGDSSSFMQKLDVAIASDTAPDFTDFHDYKYIKYGFYEPLDAFYNNLLLALQEQIKPHFLYNTIGSIRQLVNMCNNRMASDMCVELARFYRLGISGGKEIVTLEEELDHVASYLEIQKMRYGDDFEYEINVDESLLPTRILKLSLQPLVENAIYHGIKTKDGIGMILVSGKMQEDKIILTVFDDGVGIEPESLVDLRSKLRLPPEINHTKYFGLRNVNTRLKLYFGEESGVVLESVPGVYTQVSLVIPLAKARKGESFDA